MARLDSGAPITGGTMAKALIRIVTCGSVDDGKSTLIGRLLFDSKMLFEDQLAALNYPSVSLPTMPGRQSFTRTVRSVLGQASAWAASGSAPAGARRSSAAPRR